MTSARTCPPGVTSWVGAEVDAVEAARDVYSGLVGWTVTPPRVPHTHAVAPLDGQDVAGLGGRTGTPSGWWKTYVAVDGLELTIAAIPSDGPGIHDRQAAVGAPRSGAQG